MGMRHTPCGEDAGWAVGPAGGSDAALGRRADSISAGGAPVPVIRPIDLRQKPRFRKRTCQMR